MKKRKVASDNREKRRQAANQLVNLLSGSDKNKNITKGAFGGGSKARKKAEANRKRKPSKKRGKR